MTMTQLNLTETEVLTLKKTLDGYISDLRMEITDTDDKDFRDRFEAGRGNPYKDTKVPLVVERTRACFSNG